MSVVCSAAKEEYVAIRSDWFVPPSKTEDQMSVRKDAIVGGERRGGGDQISRRGAIGVVDERTMFEERRCEGGRWEAEGYEVKFGFRMNGGELQGSDA